MTKQKLYDGAWVELAGYGPQQARRVEDVFEILTFKYLECGRAIRGHSAPEVLLIFSRGCFRVVR